MEKMMIDQITVAKSDVGVLEKFITKMNKKALKFGLPPISIEKVRDDVKTRTVGVSRDGETEWDDYDVVVSVFNVIGADGFQIGGYEFVGTVDYLENSTIINKNPTIEDPVPDRFTKDDMMGVCEHCNISRYRKYIYIIREVSTGEFKQVGKSCLKDFLDVASVAMFEFVSQFFIQLKDVDDDGMWGGCGGGSRDRSFKPVDIISFAVAEIGESGFVSSARAEEMMMSSTAQRVGYSMTTNNTKDVTFPNDADDEKAEKIVKWCSELPVDSNEYLTKLGQLSREKGVTNRHIGILASAPVAYNNQMDFIERKRLDDERKDVADDVVEGNGLEIECSIISFKEHYTDYGMSLKMVVQDVRGFRLWGSVPSSLSNVDVGDNIKFVANVSKSDTDPKFGFFKRPRKAVVV
jgi:hypothetical protein